MINRKFQNLIEDLQSVHMTREEKSDVLHRTFEAIDKLESNYAFNSSTPDEMRLVSAAKKVKSNFYTAWYGYVAQRKFVPALAALLVLIGTGGMSLAAEGSLPGDSLYSVKVNVNEQVKSFTAVTPEAKAKFALEVTDKRLKEAAILSQSGKLNTETGLILTKQLKKQADQVKNQVASLVSVNNLKVAQEIAGNFESSLRAHELILEEISGEKGSENPVHLAQLDGIITTLKTEIATTTISRNTIQTKEVLAVNSENKQKIQLRLNEVKMKLAEIRILAASTSVSSEIASTTNIYVAEAIKLIASADIKLTKSQFAEALAMIQSANQFATDAEVVLSTDLTTDSSVRTVANQAISKAPYSLSSFTSSSTALSISSSVDASSTAATETGTSTASTTDQTTN